MTITIADTRLADQVSDLLPLTGVAPARATVSHIM